MRALDECDRSELPDIPRWCRGFSNPFLKLGLWVDNRSDRSLRIAGLLLILLSFLVSPRLLGPLFAPDRRITGPGNVALIALFEALCAAAGFLLAFRPARSRRRAYSALTVVGRDWIPGLLTPTSGEEAGSALALNRHTPPAPWEWLFIIILVVGSLLYWAGQYNFYYVPNADWGSFDQTADEIWSGEFLSGFKRLPTFPFLLGLVAKFISAEPPRFHAALVLNMALSAGCLVLIFLICRRCIGWLAVIPVLLTAGHKHFTLWALQPIAEPSILFFLLLTIYLFQIRSRWQYAAALAASLTRYDATPIIPIIFFLNLLLDRPWTGFAALAKAWRHWLKHAVLALVASIGIIVWAALIMANREDRSPYPTLARQGVLDRFSVWPGVSTFTEPFDVPWGHKTARLVGFGGVSLLFALGAYASLGLPLPKRLRGPVFRRGSLVILLVFATLLIFHMVFGVNRKRYTYPTLWIVHFYALGGVTCLFSLIAPELLKAWNKYSGHLAGAVMAVAAAHSVFRLRERLRHIESVEPGPFYLAFATFLLLLLLGYLLFRFRRALWILLPVAVLMTSLVGLPIMHSVRRYAGGTLSTKYKKYEYLLAGQWLLKNLKPGERAILTNTGMLKHHAGGRINKEVTGLKYISARNHRELIECMKKGNISYLIFTPRSSLYDKERQKRGKYLKWNIFLLEPFKWGRDPPGFRRIHTFPIFETGEMPRGYVYKLVPDDPRIEKLDAPAP